MGGVMHMDGTEIGAYTMLIIAHYQLGSSGLPDDDKKLCKISRLSGKQWASVKATVLEKFKLTNGFWRHEKVIEIIRQIEMKSSEQKSKALKRWNTNDATALPDECQPLTTNQKPITSKKVSKNPLSPPKGEMVLPEWMPISVWEGFKSHRGSKFTPHAQKLAIGKLERWRSQGHDPTEIINTTIMNGWKGLFEPEGKTNGRFIGNITNLTKSQRLDKALDDAVAELTGQDSTLALPYPAKL